MAAGNIFTLMINDGEQDQILYARDHLHKSLSKSIEKKLEKWVTYYDNYFSSSTPLKERKEKLPWIKYNISIQDSFS